MSYGLSFSEEFYAGPDEYDSGEPFTDAFGRPTTLLSAIRAMSRRDFARACRANGLHPDYADAYELVIKAREHDTCANISSPVEVYLDAEREHSVKVYDDSHAVYGSGMVGCLYDNGPHTAKTVKDAIEAALFIFSELPQAELKRARRNLRADGIHYFSERYRLDAGADLVSVRIERGPCPAED